MTRKFSGSELVIATHNKGKVAEIYAMFAGAAKNRGIKLSSAADHGLEEPEETGTTFLENAILKAKFVAAKTGKIALADDSGFCVDALNGAPGVYTANWAEEPGKPRNWDLARQKVRDKIADSDNKKSHFTCVFTLCWPDGHCETAEGIAHGKFVWPPRGNMDFGFDPVFVPEGYDITYGEMEEQGFGEKNKISHRAEAFRKMMDKCF